MHVLVDYLTFTDKRHSKDYWVEKLGLTEVRLTVAKPRYMWTEHLYYNGAHIYTSDLGETGIELSGTGCRLIETLNEGFDWFGLVSDLTESKAHISRLDIACDDQDGILDFRKMYKHVKNHKYISRARRVIWTDGDEQQIVFGSPQSDTRLRIYNKAMERGFDDDTHWIRAEFQLRNEQAQSFVNNWRNERSLSRAFAGVLLYYLRFTVKAPDKNHNNGRIETVSWWDAFLGECEQLPGIFLGGLEYNQERLDKAMKMCLSTVATFVGACGGDMTRLTELISYAELNPQQREFLDNLEREQRDNTKSGRDPELLGFG